MEEEGGLRLIDQRGDVADVDRLVQVDELAGLAQAVEELAEILLHAPSPNKALNIKQRHEPPSRSASHRADIVFANAPLAGIFSKIFLHNSQYTIHIIYVYINMRYVLTIIADSFRIFVSAS